MLRLSANVISSAILLLHRLESYHFSSLTELAYAKISFINVEDVFDFSQGCGWVCKRGNAPVVTSRGKEILNLYHQGLNIELKRLMLTDYIIKMSPVWSARVPYGRSEAAIFMTNDERACFSEAGLLAERLDYSIVEWWDAVANRLRARDQQRRSDIGRIGETNSIRYERKRTNSDPKWMSVDSNLVGYDIQSKLSVDDDRTLLIEVKTSTTPLDQSMFHVTSHEWNVALTSPAYVFHLWHLIGDKKFLAIVSPDDINPYIPDNNLTGEWENVKIPFSSFKDKFFELKQRGQIYE